MDMLADGCARTHTYLVGDGWASCSGSKTVAAVLFSEIFFLCFMSVKTSIY